MGKSLTFFLQCITLQKVGKSSGGKQSEDKMNHIEEMQTEFDKLSQTLRSESTK
jgi:hypothetical protein